MKLWWRALCAVLFLTPSLHAQKQDTTYTLGPDAGTTTGIYPHYYPVLRIRSSGTVQMGVALQGVDTPYAGSCRAVWCALVPSAASSGLGQSGGAFASLSAAVHEVVRVWNSYHPGDTVVVAPTPTPVVDTIRAHVTIYDSTKVVRFDTTVTHVPVTKYDTTVTRVPVTRYDTTTARSFTVYDTTHVPVITHVAVTKYDTTHVPITRYDTTHVPVTKYDTTHKAVLTYDTTHVAVTKYDTAHVAITKYDTTHVPITVYDTARVITTRDTVYLKVGDTLSWKQGDIIAIPVRVYDPAAPPVTKYDTTHVAVIKYDTTITHVPITKYDTTVTHVAVTKFDTTHVTVYDTARVVTTRDTVFMRVGESLVLQHGDTVVIPIRVLPKCDSVAVTPVPAPVSLRIDDTQAGNQRGDMNVYQDSTYLGRLAYQTNNNGTRSWMAYKAGPGGMNRLPLYYADSLTAMKALAGQAVDSVPAPAATTAEMPRTVMDTRLPPEYFATRQVFDLVGQTLVPRKDPMTGGLVCSKIILNGNVEQPTYFVCPASAIAARKPSVKKVPVRKAGGTRRRVDVRASKPCDGPCESLQ